MMRDAGFLFCLGRICRKCIHSSRTAGACAPSAAPRRSRRSSRRCSRRFAGRPSSNNRQPWRVIVVRSEEAHEKFNDCLNEGNRQWAVAAPLKMVIIGNPEEQPAPLRAGSLSARRGDGAGEPAAPGQRFRSDRPRHGGMGRGEGARELPASPEPFRVAALFAVGYPGKTEELHPDVQAKDKKPPARKDPAEIFFWDAFGQGGEALEGGTRRRASRLTLPWEAHRIRRVSGRFMPHASSSVFWRA